MQYKETRSLFLKKYQYKIVLVCPGASLFRGNDIDNALLELSKIDQKQQTLWTSRLTSAFDREYVKSLCYELKKITDYDIRVESPSVNLYTNDIKVVKLFEKKYADRIKYISKPDKENSLSSDTVIMRDVPFDYRITMGSTKQEYTAFIEWAENNAKIRLTKSCKRDLARTRSWGGTHFYVTGDNNLLMSKMHLGGTISKIQRIIHQAKV